MSRFYDGHGHYGYGRQKKIHKKFICVYDADVRSEVWFEWNMNERNSKIERWNPETKRLWWMEWDIDCANSQEADEIPSITPWTGCSHSANYRPPDPSPPRKRRK